MFLSTHELEHGRHVARLHRRRRRAYAPTSNTASHDTHEKINPWVSFCSLIWVWGSTWRPSAAELRYLTIRPVARKGYGSIAHEAKPNGLLTRGP